MTQKELKELYQKEAAAYWKDKSMTDYCVKKAAYIVELEDGKYTIIDKPTISKDFCFGYGYCGVSTEEDYQDAANMAKYARIETDYFMDYNLRGLNEAISNLKDDNLEVYSFVGYNGQDVDTKRRSFRITELWDNPEYKPFAWNVPDLKKLTDQERKALLAGYEEVKKAFVKRLNTYLKRYGLSKVRTWTYLSD